MKTNTKIKTNKTGNVILGSVYDVITGTQPIAQSKHNHHGTSSNHIFNEYT